MRTAYGRVYANIWPVKLLLLIDLGPDVFDSATVDTCILLIQNADSANNMKGLTLAKEDKDKNIAELVNKNAVDIQKLTEKTWFIGSGAEHILKLKIEAAGVPLKDWDININYGIKTGLNEAFIIDTATKEKLCAEDPKSVEILKPILRGRDIKRYHYNWAGLWLIFIPWHFPLHGNCEIQGASREAEEAFKAQYLFIYNHLKGYKEKLSRRNVAETGVRYEWYALQRWAANYHPEFEKEKIVWQEMARQPQFSYDSYNFYCLDTCRLLTGKNIKYLAGIFCSSHFNYTFSNYYAGGGLGEKGVRYKSEFMKTYPIPVISNENRSYIDLIGNLVSQITALKKQDKNADTQELEREIDQLVYKLYDLTPEEIAIVEEGVKM